MITRPWHCVLWPMSRVRRRNVCHCPRVGTDQRQVPVIIHDVMMSPRSPDQDSESQKKLAVKTSTALYTVGTRPKLLAVKTKAGTKHTHPPPANKPNILQGCCQSNARVYDQSPGSLPQATRRGWQLVSPQS